MIVFVQTESIDWLRRMVLGSQGIKGNFESPKSRIILIWWHSSKSF